MIPIILHATAKELCNILDISIIMNMLEFKPNFRAMSHKVMIPKNFLISQYLPKLYKESEAVVTLVRQKVTRNQVN